VELEWSWSGAGVGPEWSRSGSGVEPEWVRSGSVLIGLILVCVVWDLVWTGLCITETFGLVT
jgi:hypothetical protein